LFSYNKKQTTTTKTLCTWKIFSVMDNQAAFCAQNLIHGDLVAVKTKLLCFVLVGSSAQA